MVCRGSGVCQGSSRSARYAAARVGAGEGFVEDDAEGVDVGSCVDVESGHLGLLG